MDYQTHQARLLPILAKTFAVIFAGQRLTEEHEQLMARLEMKDTTGLKAIHATSSGLKAFCTWWCLESIETCRQCCGGLGYSSYSGLPSMLQDYAVHCTWEGDNTVMALQNARVLIHAFKHQEDATGFMSYLRDGDFSPPFLANMGDARAETVQLQV